MIQVKTERIKALLIDLILEEFNSQGHKLTGTFAKSLEGREIVAGPSTSVQILHVAYGRFVEKGVRPNRIPYTRRRGGGTGSTNTSKYIEGLKMFVRLRGLTSGLESEVTSVAFAIANTQKREGMPTKASRAFSRSSRRTGFIEYSTTQGSAQIDEAVAMAGQEGIKGYMDKKLQAHFI